MIAERGRDSDAFLSDFKKNLSARDRRPTEAMPREAKPFTRPFTRLRGFELCECSESVIIVRLTADPMTFLPAIPCPVVSPRRSFSAEMGALAKEDVQCAVTLLPDEGPQVYAAGVTLFLLPRQIEPMADFIITPKVEETQEFIEIANDFANPLDLVREAVSNSFDAHATEIRLSFEAETTAGETIFVIRVTDNGTGMKREDLQSFFDLGNSTRRGDNTTIGEKGHGTKVYFNAKKLVVDTQRDGNRLIASLDAPFAKLHERKIPEVNVREEPSETQNSGTTVTIYGYNNNRRERFTHDRLRDHILWFTKFGSVERQFGINAFANENCSSKDLTGTNSRRWISGIHFLKRVRDVNALFNDHSIQAPRFYCDQIESRTPSEPSRDSLPSGLLN